MDHIFVLMYVVTVMNGGPLNRKKLEERNSIRSSDRRRSAPPIAIRTTRRRATFTILSLEILNKHQFSAFAIKF